MSNVISFPTTNAPNATNAEDQPAMAEIFMILLEEEAPNRIPKSLLQNLADGDFDAEEMAWRLNISLLAKDLLEGAL